MISNEKRARYDTCAYINVDVTPLTDARCRTAYAWAERLGQSRAYDGFYLALAEELGGMLYTGDRRLTNSARQLELSWVRWIGD